MFIGTMALVVYCNSCTGRDRKNQTVRYGGKNVSGSGGNRSQFFSVSDKHPHGTGKKLLLSTPLSIAEVSERSGYGDYRVFTKAFKKSEGVTPSQYRRNFLEE